MELFEIKAEITPSAVEETDNILLELGIEGWSLLEDIIVKRAWIVGIFPSAEEARTRWTELQPMLTSAPLTDAECRPLGDRDWRDSYKAHFKAWTFGRLHWVPVWERATHVLPPGDAVIWLDPGMAFGTGNHETTRLCVERLVTVAAQKGTTGRVIDAGCGSGILALSAAKLGFRGVEAFDNDPESITVSEENAALNASTGDVKFSVGDLVSGLAGRQADILLANIQADVLMRFARELTAAVAPGGALALSGILAHENEQVQAAFKAIVPTWSCEGRVMGEWSDVFMVRPE